MFTEINLEDITLLTYIIKIFFLAMCTYIIYTKIINQKRITIKQIILEAIMLFIISIITTILKYDFNSLIAIVEMIFSIGLATAAINKQNVGYSVLVSTISLSINYIVFFMTVLLMFILNIIFPFESDIINLIIMIIFHIIILTRICKIKRFKNGISFLNKKAQEDYFDVIIMNISVTILYSNIVFPYVNIERAKDLVVGFIIFAIIMIITINRTIQLYYKHKLLIKELENTKEELQNAKTEITNLEQDNLNISKTGHTLAHKQEILEYKINKLIMQEEVANELELKEQVEKLSKDIYDNKVISEIQKTEVQEIDDVLEFIGQKCIKEDICLNVQVLGNIYHMVNKIISKEELQTLLIDHTKDAVIAIKHCDNVNKSILIKLGKIDESYGLYIYDSGVEFDEKVIENLGKKPITTYKNEGGTGMGFMNTFDTLNKYKASLTIEKIGKPSKENFTKVIMIKFDGKNDFKVI